MTGPTTRVLALHLMAMPGARNLINHFRNQSATYRRFNGA
jgi:hypothetical protein